MTNRLRCAIARRVRSWSSLGGRLLGTAVLLAASVVVQARADVDARGGPAPVTREAIVLTLHGAIGPVSARLVERTLRDARTRGAALVVLTLDTPGGLDAATRVIVQAILASDVPVATWVGPQGARAASAGTFVLLASHVAAMAPATTVGAATPVALGGRGAPGRPADGPGAGAGNDRARDADGDAGTRGAPRDAMTHKQVNDAAAFVRGLAARHERNADWAERAVREAATLTARDAVAQRVADLVVDDVPELLERIDGRTVRAAAGPVTLSTRGLGLVERAPSAGDRLLAAIANPSVALLLMTIGVYGLLFEFASPGFGLGGTVGAIALLLGLFALQMLPFEGAGLALLALGAALLVAEVLSPTFGVLGLGGAIALGAGALMLFDRDVPALAVPWPLAAALAVGALVAAIGTAAMALRVRGRPSVDGAGDLVGATGEVVSVDEDAAWAQVRGQHWRVAASAPLAAGQRVRVTGARGLVLDVSAEPDLAAPAQEA